MAEQEQEQKKPELKPVVSGKVTVKKKNGFQKLISDIFQEDIRTVKGNLYRTIFIPWMKKMISDLGTNTVNMIVYGEPRGDSGINGRRNYQKISWKSYYDDDDDRYDNRYSSTKAARNRAVYDIGEINYDEYRDAKAVLDCMQEIISSEYKMVTVRQYLELSGAPNNWNDDNYGWTNISNAVIDNISTADGIKWVIKLPRPLPIK